MITGKHLYDGEGKRVKKVTNLETTVFVYSGGKLVAEYSTKLADQPAVNYTTSDYLGTPRIITDQLGQTKSRRDYMPFGEDLWAGIGGRSNNAEQRYSATADEVRQKFTGYQKDTETNLDFAEARMYNNAHGRFTAVDPLLASGNSANPQTFNRYVYVGNNPVMITDPSGLTWYYNKNLNRNDWYDEETKKFFWGGGGLTNDWSVVTEGVGAGHFVYGEGESWTALDPNSTSYSPWATFDQAKFEYGANSNYGGYGDIPVYGTFVLPMVSGIKTGNPGRALYGFYGTAITFATLPRSIAGAAKEVASEGFSYFTGFPALNINPRRFSGGRELTDLDWGKAADTAYAAIRKQDDVADIALNSGMQEFRIARIKDHLFNNTHILDDGVRKFDADPLIVNAWNRLQKSTHTRVDLDLLKHEYFESRFEGIFKTNYRQAHDAALKSGRLWNP